MKIKDVKSWGIDIGNVLIKNVPYETQQYYWERQLTPDQVVNHLQLIPDALLGLRFLIHKVGKENVWVVSKANPIQAAISRLAFDKFKVYAATGLDPSQVLFVTERPDKVIVFKALELEGCVDDHGEVIALSQSVVKCPIWFKPNPKYSAQWIPQMRYSTRVVSGWTQFLTLF